MTYSQATATDAEQVRAFFTRLAQGVSLAHTSEVLHSLNSRSLRPIERTRETFRFETMRESDFGVGLPPLANC